AHLLVIVVPYGVPMDPYGLAFSRSVDGSGTVPLRRPLDLFRKAMAEIEHPHLVHDAQARGLGVCDRILPPGDRVETLHGKVKVWRAKAAYPERILKVPPTIQLSVLSRHGHGIEAIFHGCETQVGGSEGLAACFNGACVGKTRIDELHPVGPVVVPPGGCP